MPIRLLSVIAHPDDEIGVGGGTFLHLKEKHGDGVETMVACATKGESGTSRGHDPAVRLDEMRRACEMLRIDQLRYLGFPNGEMIRMLSPVNGKAIRHERELPVVPALFRAEVREETDPADRKAAAEALGALAFNETPALDGFDWEGHPLRPLTRAVVGVMREFRPDIVMAFEPFGASGHNEHIMVHHAATTAFFLAGRDDVWPDLQLRPHAPRELWWGCISYADNLPPGFEFLDGIREEMGIVKVEPDLVVEYGRETATRLYEAKAAHVSQYGDLTSFAEAPAWAKRRYGSERFCLAWPKGVDSLLSKLV